MKNKLFQGLFLIFLIFSILSFNSCSERNETVSCFPDSYINVTLNLNLPAYYELQNVGGWKYIDEQSSGTRGLIVVRTNGGFKVYDRNAPHLCPADDTTLSVESDIKITCPKDGAEWILLTGQPTKIASIAPKTYSYSYNSANNTLTIYR
ncbi:MAG: hypothetical protein QM564_04620 [Bergeyella sp.]